MHSKKTGYLYQEGMVMSPDGHCRAFDVNAQGTTIGNGVGLVMLKRLEDAVADGDRIYAVIKGSAINNDGSQKVGYTAPSVTGQAEVILEAQSLAEVDVETISYVETHGTGTPLGDPIEIAALTRAFRQSTQKTGFCAIGAVKTNIGHLDTAAGVAGLIKTVMALQHKQLPPSLNFEQPNPQIDFANSPFYVKTSLAEWKSNGIPRRAGVSSFGIGGTNAHVIVEEAPAVAQETIATEAPGKPWQLLLLSARTPSALDTASADLAAHLQQHADCNLADVAYTLSVGRTAFSHRRILVCSAPDDAARALSGLDAQRVLTGMVGDKTRPVVFMFSGQGSQYVNMGRDLYQSEPLFREQVERCCEMLQPHLGLDLRTVLYPQDELTGDAAHQLEQTAITQPALFVMEYALAQLWQSWGVHPKAAIGHSIGEYVAATLAGVFSLEDALALVAARGQMMQQLPGGAMLAIPLPEHEVYLLLGQTLSLAAINGPSRCVVSGPGDAIDALQQQLTEQKIPCRRLHTSHAFHSQMMEPILQPFTARLQRVRLNPPQLPYVSNVTGTWMTAADATDPTYWARHLRSPVRFAQGVETIQQQDAEQILLEVGPGRTLSTLVNQHPGKAAGQVVLTSVRHPQQADSDVAFGLKTLGQLWMHGCKVDWPGFYADQQRCRVLLPTYPFERQRCWIDRPLDTVQQVDAVQPDSINMQTTPQPGKKPDMADWFYVPVWKRTPLITAATLQGPVLILMDRCHVGERLMERLLQVGQQVIAVQAGDAFGKQAEDRYVLNPGVPDDYDALFNDLGSIPPHIVHLWSVAEPQVGGLEWVDEVQRRGFHSLLFLAQALGRQNRAEPCHLTVCSNNMQEVAGEAWLYPEKATLLGPVTVIPQEYGDLTCRSVDVMLPQTTWQEAPLTHQLLEELAAPSAAPVIAYRGHHRWVRSFDSVHLEGAGNGTLRLREGGVYLITGGLGGIGLALAEYLAKTVRAKLILTGRSAFPERSEWDPWLAAHPEQDDVSRKIRSLQTLEALGAEVMALQADVAEFQQMQVVMTRAQVRFGQLHGVIHAAGVPGGGAIQRKTRDIADAILAPKVQGTLVLDALLKDGELDWWILCSSLTAMAGGFGQVDYCAANAFLDAFAHDKTNRDGTHTVSINWDTWQEVGMAVEAAKTLAQHAGFSPTPLQDDVPHPLFEHCIVEGEAQAIYTTQFSVHKHWVLDEHRLVGQATLPATAYLEMARAAFEHQVQCGAMELRDVFLLQPLVVAEDEEIEVQTRLTQQGEEWQFSIMSQAAAEPATWREHARGTLTTVEDASPKPYDIGEIQAICRERERVVTEDQAGSRTDYIEASLRWQTLKQAYLGADRSLTLCELPDAYTEDLNCYALHPTLLDGATNFLSAPDERFYLPFSYQKLRVLGPLPKTIYSYIRPAEQHPHGQDTLAFDITIMDEHGSGWVEIEAYVLRTLALEPTDDPGNGIIPSPVGIPASSPVERQLLQHGLLSAEGVEAFNRILSHSFMQVLVSTQDLELHMQPGLKASTMREEGPDADITHVSKPKSPRPVIEQTYIAPESELEHTIAQVWQDFLGIEQVGIHDDFFEIGGDSLLAIQLTSALSDALQAKLSPNHLMSAPTVAALAAIVDEMNAASAATEIRPQPSRSTVLVPLQSANSQTTPLFLIHPVGGSIYDYRYLARNLDAELPVYAMQARGLDGEDTPFTQVEDMATYYLSLLQGIQPQGPYQFGGWSLGGLVAFEMAQQLRSRGEEVARLVMIDSFFPSVQTGEVDDATYASYFASYMGAMVGKTLSLSVHDLRQLDAEAQLRLIVTEGRRLGILPPELEAEQIRHRLAVYTANFRAMDDYRPQPYAGDIIFFCSSDSGQSSQDASLGWAAVAAGKLALHEIPGDHYSIIQSPVLAETLRGYLLGTSD